MENKSHSSNFRSRPFFWWRDGLGFGLAVVATLVIAVQLSTALTPTGITEASVQVDQYHAQQGVRLDLHAGCDAQTLTVWEAAQERKTERENEDDETANALESDVPRISFSFHAQKSKITQRELSGDTRAEVSLVVLHHSWKSFLS